MPDKVLVVGATVVVVGGLAAIAYMMWKDSDSDAEKRARLRASGMSVSTSWGTPKAASGVMDSLGLVVYPEMYEQGRFDERDACAWEGCIGEIDSDGYCTGCPQM
jgi:hypothetical protein